VLLLPEHHYRAQARAVASSLSLQSPALVPVPREMINMVLCPVCNRVYSVVNRPLSAIKNSFRFGLRDARVDILADERTCFCYTARAVGHMRCGTSPLVQIPLLGQMLVFQRDMYVLCCGEGCGIIAKLDMRRCVYTEHGYLCHTCSSKRRAEWLLRFVERGLGLSLPRPERSSAAQPPRVVCALCPSRNARAGTAPLAPLRQACKQFGDTPADEAHFLTAHFATSAQTNALPLFVYPAGLLLCSKHHTPDLAEFIQSRCSPFSPAAEVHSYIVSWHKARRQYYHELYRPRDRAVLAAMRSENRGHRPGRFIYNHAR